MLPLSFYAAFVGTIISVVGWAYLARKKHNHDQPLPLSYLFISSRRALIFSRVMLWVCGLLFAITLYFFIAPRIPHGSYVLISWSIALLCEVMVGIFPASGKTEPLHNIIAFIMGFGFLVLAVVFSLNLSGLYSTTESILTAAMVVLGALGVIYYKTRFLFFELPYIWVSHITVLVAALALR
jgi:hypothetical protein